MNESLLTVWSRHWDWTYGSWVLTMLPEVIFLFTGKRKSGKDFLSDELQNIYGNEDCTIIKISHPIKSYWAETNKLNLEKLLGDGEYKEIYRQRMILWGEDMRNEDYGCFCRLACKDAKVTKIWIVSDIRRKTDIKWFRETYGEKIKTVKIFTNDEVRKSRGWIYTEGVDNVQSECDLDDVNEWDFVIDNNDNNQDVREKLKDLLNYSRTTMT